MLFNLFILLIYLFRVNTKFFKTYLGKIIDIFFF
uniref:Photosystem II protein I n=1 Tax=Cyanoptyche gloeocystis TaxID=77922 RepID=A0A3G1IWD9_9EUKA|nr:hypothetical protein [Cyanoptyche gloeocystis]